MSSDTVLHTYRAYINGKASNLVGLMSKREADLINRLNRADNIDRIWVLQSDEE